MNYSQNSSLSHNSILEITSGNYHIIIQPWENYHHSLPQLSSLPYNKSRVAAFF